MGTLWAAVRFVCAPIPPGAGMTEGEQAVLTDLLRQAAVELHTQSEISPVSYERARLETLATALRRAADDLASEILAH